MESGIDAVMIVKAVARIVVTGIAVGGTAGKEMASTVGEIARVMSGGMQGVKIKVSCQMI